MISILYAKIISMSPTGAGAVGQCGAPRVTEPRNGGTRMFFFLNKYRNGIKYRREKK
jgi:hypothetical protein